MIHRKLFLIFFIGIFASSCGLDLNAPDEGNNGSDPSAILYRNVSSSNLPDELSQTTTKAKAGDVDNDGDLDLAVAVEFEANKILINNGSGNFTDETDSQLPGQNYDSQDIALTDFNNNGEPDIFFVGDQNETNELYINDGSGNFSDLSNRIPVTGNSTSVEALDIDGDGSTDIMIGNIGQNVMLMNSGNAAFFNNQTIQRLPQLIDPTRDFEFRDITGNNLRDIVVGNENANRVLINNGAGAFNDQSARIPFITDTEETQDVELDDIDGDGERDIYFGNSGFQNGSNPQDRLLINDGNGDFIDQTSDRLPAITTYTYDAEFVDLDGDEDLDLFAGNYNGGIRVLLNDGGGYFSDESNSWISENFSPRVMDLEIADFNGDELPDIYISVRDGDDQLLLYENNE